MHNRDDVCVFCGACTRIMDWELCPKAPEFDALPQPGQMYFRKEGFGNCVAIITFVSSTGEYRWGADHQHQTVYDLKSPQFPPPGWFLIKDGDFDPWTAQDKLDLLLSTS